MLLPGTKDSLLGGCYNACLQSSKMSDNHSRELIHMPSRFTAILFTAVLPFGILFEIEYLTPAISIIQPLCQGIDVDQKGAALFASTSGRGWQDQDGEDVRITCLLLIRIF